MKKLVYLTIDDSPTNDFRKKVGFLKNNSIPAIFFCEGHKLQDREQEVVDAINQGFLIGNHSWSHPYFDQLTQDEVWQEIESTDALITTLYQKAGVPRKLKVFRFPYLNKGGNNKLYAQLVLKELGYVQPSWHPITYDWYRKEGFYQDLDVVCTYDSMDWTVASGSHVYGIKSLQDLLDRMDEDVPEGRRGLQTLDSCDIVLVHDNPRISDFFEPLINRLIEKDD